MRSRQEDQSQTFENLKLYLKAGTRYLPLIASVISLSYLYKNTPGFSEGTDNIICKLYQDDYALLSLIALAASGDQGFYLSAGLATLGAVSIGPELLLKTAFAKDYHFDLSGYHALQTGIYGFYANGAVKATSKVCQGIKAGISGTASFFCPKQEEQEHGKGPLDIANRF